MRDSKLKAIHDQQIAYVNDSLLTVVVDENFDTVSINDADGNELVYLEEADGAEFIAEARKLWRVSGDLGLQDAMIVTAYPYADMAAEEQKC